MTLTKPQPASTESLASTQSAAESACQRIAPLWPLTHFVAANPFLGMTESSFHEASSKMEKLVPGGMQMPLCYHVGLIEEGKILPDDIAAAIAKADETLPKEWLSGVHDLSLENFLHAIQTPSEPGGQVLTIAAAVDQQIQSNWSSRMVELISDFCAAYYDENQSAWRSPWKHLPLYHAWREMALLDATPEVWGINGFRNWLEETPEEPLEAIHSALSQLGVTGEYQADFLHAQLLTLPGWAGRIQYQARELAMAGQTDDSLLHLLAIRLTCDAALASLLADPAMVEKAIGSLPLINRSASRTVALSTIAQFAQEQAWQRRLIPQLASSKSATPTGNVPAPTVQAFFCIDVRSEVFRRAIESTSSKVETHGFAGFFGLPIEYIPFGRAAGGSQCPVLLSPSFQIREVPQGEEIENQTAMLRKKGIVERIKFSWNAIKSSAISSFSFVETAGLLFGPRLLGDSFLQKSNKDKTRHNCGPTIDIDGDTGISLEDRIAVARGALGHMGLTKKFAEIVLLCGHGSETKNNPYGSGLDCGACGGHTGEANARVAAAILNDPQVRAELSGHGIEIPESTRFVPGLHNTTTDEVALFDVCGLEKTHGTALAELEEILAEAGRKARAERASLLGLDPGTSGFHQKVFSRSKDWAQVRPEWGLAGNAAFVAAPRSRTKNADLSGRVFLHHYNHGDHDDLSTLELIMTAPLVVANWINLQYYGSTVNNKAFGSGDKVLHNLVGAEGVCLGNSGDLQTGLPLQSLHDGKKWIHEPVRLHAFIEAPKECIDQVMEKHESIRTLVNGGWLLLFAIEGEGALIQEYVPKFGWKNASQSGLSGK